MKKILTILSVVLTACATGNPGEGDTGRIQIDLAERGHAVPESMYGIFFEEINHAGDGGLYAELIQNRGFEDSTVPEGYRLEGGELRPPALPNHLTGALPSPDMKLRWNTAEIPAWTLQQTAGSGASMYLNREYPLDPATPTALCVALPTQSRTTVTNSGYWGIHIEKGKNYRLVLYTSNIGRFKGDVTVRLISENGSELCSHRIDAGTGKAWKRHDATLTPTDSDSRARFVIELDGQGTLLLDYVSLFPQETFRNRENGLRRDVAETLEALHPAFIRWPGGGIVEGITLSNRVKWKETIGDPVKRPGQYNLWGYRSTYGFGYHEFLQFCEDIGADAMFVCNAGLGGQAAVGDACPEEELDLFIADALDAIDYALGDGTTDWSRRRVENGHPGPFPLKYVEIGNENWGPVYEKRYDRFYKAIKTKYPQLTIISTLGFGEQHRHEKVDLIDPHMYVSPEFFFEGARMFDGMERGQYGIYVGEYAVTQNVGDGNLLGALAEAAFLTGAERNCDLVRMTSYAPLLTHVDDRAWSPTLIQLDAHRITGRSSYYVQQLFAHNRPSYNVKNVFGQPSVSVEVRGRIALGGWNTDNEYRDLKITLADGRTVEADMSQGWKPQSGTWTTSDGSLKGSGPDVVRRNLWNTAEPFGDCTITLKARKTAGAEGFLVYFGMQDEQHGYVLNIGGWNNRSTAFQRVSDNDTPIIANYTAQQIETGRWYDIRIDIEGGHFTYYLDGKKSLEVYADTTWRFIATGYDDRTGELIVKFVNAAPDRFSATIDLAHVSNVERLGRVVTLSSQNPTDENSLDDPRKVFPVENCYDGFAEKFNYVFEPWSLTVLRIRTKIKQPFTPENNKTQQ